MKDGASRGQEDFPPSQASVLQQQFFQPTGASHDSEDLLAHVCGLKQLHLSLTSDSKRMSNVHGSGSQPRSCSSRNVLLSD